MLGYVSLLLNSDEQLVSVYRNFPAEDKDDPLYHVYEAFLSVVKDEHSAVYEKKFGELFYQITHITNYGTMQDVKEELSGIPEIVDEYRPLFYSPYGIYYLWMEAYQYLPADMKPAQ